MGQPYDEIAARALELPPEDRARLLLQLTTSLEEALDDMGEIERLWVEEALRRLAQLESGEVKGH